MDTTPDGDAAALPAAPFRPEPRQRWRLTFARAVDSGGETQAGRDYFAIWETALAASGLPIAVTDAGRLRFSVGAPLPSRTAGRAELADLLLTDRVAAWRVREALERVLPAGHELVRLDDVWLGAPALAGRVAAADYLVTLRDSADGSASASPGAIATAAERLLAAVHLPRERAKGGGVKAYDLRPLLIDIGVAADSGPANDGGDVAVRIRTRIHPELGSGRPEEVVSALADEVGAPLEVAETIRERLVLSDDLDA